VLGSESSIIHSAQYHAASHAASLITLILVRIPRTIPTSRLATRILPRPFYGRDANYTSVKLHKGLAAILEMATNAAIVLNFMK